MSQGPGNHKAQILVGLIYLVSLVRAQHTLSLATDRLELMLGPCLSRLESILISSLPKSPADRQGLILNVGPLEVQYTA
ncbi:hypothetical protein BO99DRAFT_405270 [Aspergillus violaceofuscus CBS 115571]|uniref:Secreted protein n=1 Tax=Aspergillus violaceofuscus (strain CBS 115571) TaxID=1450538 RepID=A0A2V5GXW9_ASPV1|nr:hypothetical protein BO99DRAFT_405270 [Aspergillus violaceofuscus CBS 115571]